MLEQQSSHFSEPRHASGLRSSCEPTCSQTAALLTDGGASYLASYMKPNAPVTRRLNLLSPFSVPDAPAFAAPGPVRRSTVHSPAGAASDTPPLPPRRRSAGSADTDSHHFWALHHGSRTVSTALSSGFDGRTVQKPQGPKSETDAWARDGMPSLRHGGLQLGPQMARNAFGGPSSGIPPRPNRVVARMTRRPPVMSPFVAGGDCPADALAPAAQPHQDDDMQREMSKEDFDELAAELAIGPRSASAPVLAPAMSREALPVAHSIAAVEARKLERYLREEIDLEREPADTWRDGHHLKRRLPPPLTPQVWAR